MRLSCHLNRQWNLATIIRTFVILRKWLRMNQKKRCLRGMDGSGGGLGDSGEGTEKGKSLCRRKGSGQFDREW